MVEITFPPTRILRSTDELRIRSELRGTASRYLNTWRTEAAAGAQQINIGGPDSCLYAGIALAGNLVWAATCLIGTQGLGFPVILMSFGGATVGGAAGMAAVYEAESWEKKRRLIHGIISQRLATAKGEIKIDKLVDKAYEDLIEQGGYYYKEKAPGRRTADGYEFEYIDAPKMYIERRARLLWERMFNVPYKGKELHIQQKARASAQKIADVAVKLYPRYEKKLMMLAEKDFRADWEQPKHRRFPEPKYGYYSERQRLWREKFGRPLTDREKVKYFKKYPFDRWLAKQPEYLALGKSFGLKSNKRR